MNEIIMCKLGEMALKGLNRHAFEKALIDNIKARLKPFGHFFIKSAQSTIYIEPQSEDIDIDKVVQALSKIFGLSTISRAAVCEKDIDHIIKTAAEYTINDLKDAQTFKVVAKRSDKTFPLKSPQIMDEVGGAILDCNPHIKVDVHNPQVIIYIEVRDFAAYVHAGRVSGAGGMPIGMAGKATLLLSGGIDSPVSGYMIAKRGVEINAVHFFSYPYTSERAKQKVFDLVKIMCNYCGHITLSVVPFTEIQTQIKKNCESEYFTLIMRRYMMKIAQRVAEKNASLALITGESIGQVASQTLRALVVTDDAVSIPVFRPCIGLDKEEIVQIARKIGTFETSILPYEDCCTVFTPPHPCTKPHLENVLNAEKCLDEDALIDRAVEGIELFNFNIDI